MAIYAGLGPLLALLFSMVVRAIARPRER